MTKIKVAMAAALAALLAGCGTTVTLTPRDGGPIGVGTKQGAMASHGALKIELEGRQYVGEWVVSTEGGFSGYAPDTVNDKTLGSHQLAKAKGLVKRGMDGNGDGRAYANSPDGKTLRCNFHLNAVTSVAQGLCQRDDGRLYDLTIRQ